MRTSTSERIFRNLLLPLEKGDFQEDLHPRDDDGKFAPKGAAAGPTPEEIDEIFSKVHQVTSLSPEAAHQYEEFVSAMDDKAEFISEQDFVGGTPERLLPTSDRAFAMIDALGKKIKAEGLGKNEFIFAVKNDTGDVIGLARGSRGTAPTGHIYNEMKRNSGYTVVHNHPLTDSSFSDGDLAVFAHIPQFTRFVVESMKHRYIIEKPAEWHQRRRREGLPHIAIGFKALMKGTVQDFDPGPLPDGTRDSKKDWEAWQKQSNYINDILAKAYGLKYRVEERP